LALCIAAHSSGISFMPGFESASVRESFLQWTLFSILIFCFMMLKLMLLMVVSNLFGWKDTVGIQFFNFIRMIILSLVIIALVSIVSFSVGINVNYIVMLKFACLLLATGVITIYFKLLTRATFHFFHLFFYLCATEVLPLLLLTKVLLF
jgi:predicted membrane channel-forming protein YqfA (hemolysin III family)